MSRPILLIHGYSDEGKSFDRWKAALRKANRDVIPVHTCEYETLTNEVTLADIAEGFDRALRIQSGLSEREEFDAIVHSTGMLVIRAWLSVYGGLRDEVMHKRLNRLKHLIALAPASFGSPLAHKGRSWLGALFKGRKELGPDFMEAGNRVLEALELGSRFTWDLAHKDLIGEEARFTAEGDTPYVFVFCGTKSYGWLQSMASGPGPGTDGTVRWAGCALNTRKVLVDLTVEAEDTASKGKKRFAVSPWTNADIPLIPVPGHNHSSILREPNAALINMVLAALKVSTKEELAAWYERKDVRDAIAHREKAMEHWQQFVIRMVDERGDPVPDYNIQLFTKQGRARNELKEFDLEVHTYKLDPSFRCFHVNLHGLQPDKLDNLWMRVIASSGSRIVGYYGVGSEKMKRQTYHRDGKWDAEIDLSGMLPNKAKNGAAPAGEASTTFFYPFTTTLVEIQVNREPLPLSGKNDVFWIKE